MLRAHRQAWAWQDEWHGLTMDDIRQIERQTQEALKKTMGGGGGASDEDEEDGEDDDNNKACESIANSKENCYSNGRVSPACTAAAVASLSSIEKPNLSPPALHMSPDSGAEEEEEDEKTVADTVAPEEQVTARRKLWSRSNSKATLHSPGSGSGKSFDVQMANWRMESIVRDSDSASEEEFFDCQGKANQIQNSIKIFS